MNELNFINVYVVYKKTRCYSLSRINRNVETICKKLAIDTIDEYCITCIFVDTIQELIHELRALEYNDKYIKEILLDEHMLKELIVYSDRVFVLIEQN